MIHNKTYQSNSVQSDHFLSQKLLVNMFSSQKSGAVGSLHIFVSCELDFVQILNMKAAFDRSQHLLLEQKKFTQNEQYFGQEDASNSNEQN